MKQKWIERYREASGLGGNTVDVLVGFNANIDLITKMEELDIDLEDLDPVRHEKIHNLQEFREELKYARENQENTEVKLKRLDHEIEGEERIGGQAGIMSNYLASTGNGVIFYTPFLSEELANLMNEKILYPAIEGDLVLKNVRDSANSDRTKKNIIVEYSGDRDCRVIFSSEMKGFGPYFRKGVEEKFDQIQNNVDRFILSGFHNAEGNREAKLKKSRNQLEKLEKPVHLEFVHRETEVAELVLEHIFPEIDSLGLDGDEVKRLEEILDKEYNFDEELSLGEVFELSRDLIQEFGLERVHTHTYNFQVTVTKDDYRIEPENVRRGMLFGHLSAIKTCDKGGFPSPDDFEILDMDDKHLHRLDDLENFGDFFNLENFPEKGIAEVDGYRIVAIPPLIHEDPSRVVGMGDIISAGSFTGEIK